MKAAKKRNVLIVTVDCLRADHLGCFGYKKDVSPNIDLLAQKGALFTQCYSNAPYTNASLSSFLTGTYPLYQGNVLIKNRITIAEILRKEGWLTAAYHSNPQLSRFSEYKKGFDIFEDLRYLASATTNLHKKKELTFQKLEAYARSIGKKFKRPYGVALDVLLRIKRSIPWRRRRPQRPSSSAIELTRKATSWLDKSSSPFFLWLHYMNVHHPYFPPRNFFERFSDRKYDVSEGLYFSSKALNGYYLSRNELNYLLDLYDASINYVDYAVAELISKMKGDKMLEDTILILTADHGEEFYDHGHFGHYGHPERARPMKLYNEMLHVPLVILAPEIRGKITQPVSLIDIAPTILDLLNIPKIKEFQGKSLVHFFKSSKGEESHLPIIVEATEPGDPIGYLKNPNRLKLCSFITHKWKFIHHSSKQRVDELFNLKKDPNETTNLFNTYPKVAEEFKLQIVKHLNENKKLKSEAEKVKQIVKKLKRMGRI